MKKPAKPDLPPLPDDEPPPSVLDYAEWLPTGDAEFDEWIEAIEDVDQYGDPERLIACLLILPVSPKIAPHLEDLLRRKLTSKAVGGRPPEPSYDRSAQEMNLDFAVAALKRAIKKDGIGTIKTASEGIGRRCSLSPATLRSAFRQTGPRWYKDAKVKRGEWKKRPARGP